MTRQAHAGSRVVGAWRDRLRRRRYRDQPGRATAGDGHRQHRRPPGSGRQPRASAAEQRRAAVRPRRRARSPARHSGRHRRAVRTRCRPACLAGPTERIARGARAEPAPARPIGHADDRSCPGPGMPRCSDRPPATASDWPIPTCSSRSPRTAAADRDWRATRRCSAAARCCASRWGRAAPPGPTVHPTR